MTTDAPLVSETIEVLAEAPNPLDRWNPVVGNETLALLDHVANDLETPDIVQAEARDILAKCVAPDGSPDQAIGLVIGYVQSGKTMSFTTIAAMARDNGFQLIIVVTGTSLLLFEQSSSRLERDLRLQTRQDRAWQHFRIPPHQANTIQSIADTLADWKDRQVPENERRTILITVMKNHSHLDFLAQILQRLPLERVPALLIDDEADQAGLNTGVNRGLQSSTYCRLLNLRRQVPHHTYLQYTATPQAPLLINIIDTLSPRFAEVLTPGTSYVGGREFFEEHRELLSIIPANEIPPRGQRLQEVPESLLAAMRVYFLGVAAGWVLDGGTGNRSMMVHPSQLTARHAEYVHWVQQAKTLWQDLLSRSDTDPDRRELIRELEVADADLRRTVPDLPGFEELHRVLPRAIRNTQVIEFNRPAGTTTEVVAWRRDYAHILVGGQAMDRGFTVEGLTVTYMPRDIGVGHADTVQQRARFFGYKRSYLGYCRIYLEQTAHDAYRHYVEHEEDIRQQLASHTDAGRPLPEWKRAFFLNNNLRPTRQNVLDLDYMRGNFANRWYQMKFPLYAPSTITENRLLLDRFCSELAFREDDGHPERTPIQRHLVANVPLAQLYEEFLTRFLMGEPEDSDGFTGLRLQVREYVEHHGEAHAAIYRMSPREQRHRSLMDDGQIIKLFQGEYPVNPPAQRGTIYPGDEAIRSNDYLTVQLHDLTVHEGRIDGPTLERSVPVLAIWVPNVMSRDWIVQQ